MSSSDESRQPQNHPAVVVGVDGPPGSEQALRWVGTTPTATPADGIQPATAVIERATTPTR